MHKAASVAVHISFEVVGNGRERDGNPVPYTRTTQRGKWKQDRRGRLTPYGRYCAYAKHVLAALDRDAARMLRDEVYPMLAGKDSQYLCDIRIQFKGRSHGDCDNVVKGIVDALFYKSGVSDKLVVPRLVAMRDGADCGRVWVVLHGPYPRGEFAYVANRAKGGSNVIHTVRHQPPDT